MIKFKDLLKQEKVQKQIYKLLIALIVCLFFLLAVELVFQIPQVSNFFGSEALEGSKEDYTLIWVVLWALMFAQVTLIPMPAIPIYAFCMHTTLIADQPGIQGLFSTKTLFFVLFIVSASITGAISAYWLGRFGGKSTVKWIAGGEEEYQKWCKSLNGNVGKWLYAATIILPIFPDDILCVIVGSMKMDFGFYILMNSIGRFIGTYCMLIFMRIPGIDKFFSGTSNGFPWMVLILSLLLLFAIITTLIWKKKFINKPV